MSLQPLLDMILPVFVGTGLGAAVCSYLLKLVKRDILDQLDSLIRAQTKPLQDQVDKDTAATTAALRWILKQMLAEHLSRGSITTADLDFLTGIFDSYHDLGGNGVIAKMYRDVLDLPVAGGAK